MKRLLISGADGRMGREVARLAAEHGFEARPFAHGTAADVIVDFSHPDCLDSLLQAEPPLVIGTTGYTREQQLRIDEAAQTRPVFQAANFSPGFHALQVLARHAKDWLPDWDFCLIERHHAAKRDRPSGTALVLAQALKIDQVLSVRGGTVRGVHELCLYGAEESLILTHTAESRAVFAHGALRAAAWLLGREKGLYGMADMLPINQ